MKTPAFFIAARVLKKYRGRSSFGFLLRWTVWHRLRGGDVPALPETILDVLGVHNARLEKITGIYNGLEREAGAVQAARACVEIVQGIENR